MPCSLSVQNCVLTLLPSPRRYCPLFLHHQKMWSCRRARIVVIMAALQGALTNASNNTSEGSITATDTCGNGRGDARHTLRRGLQAPEFNTIPPDGWSNHVAVSGGLEWLYASSVYVTDNYYLSFPNHLQNQSPCCCSINSFPAAVKYSGFRLPTTAEVMTSKPFVPPPCMSHYTNKGSATHCDVSDYARDDPITLVTSDGGCWSSCCETVYVRPVGTVDAGQPCGDNGDRDKDGFCDDIDNCVNTPNPLQGYAFLVRCGWRKRNKVFTNWRPHSTYVLSIGH